MPSEKYTTQRVSNDYITLNNCGQQTLDAHDYDTVRDDGRVDFGLQFIESGQCIYEDNGIVNIAEEGSLLLHFPGVRQHYSFKKMLPHILCGLIFPESAVKCLMI